MLWFNYSEATARRRFTLIYRGYDLEVTRESSTGECAFNPEAPTCLSWPSVKCMPPIKIRRLLKPRSASTERCLS